MAVGGEACGAKVVAEGLAFLGEDLVEEGVDAFGVEAELGEAGGELEAEDG